MYSPHTAYEFLRTKTDFTPRLAIVLGSGLGSFADECVDVVSTVDYKDIPGFPSSTVSGHKGRFVFGYVGGVPCVIMQGRVHYYEGYPMVDTVATVRTAGLLGAKKLIVTNAAGGINSDFSPGDLMLITGHISSFVPSPLIGKNDDTLGTRFPDMTQVYSKQMTAVAEKVSARLGIGLKKGVYLQLGGPNYETPEEIRMCRILGADAVGMSTATEAMAARHMGLEVLGISCITNLAAGISKTPLSHDEVKEAADKVAPVFKALLKGIITETGKV